MYYLHHHLASGDASLAHAAVFAIALLGAALLVGRWLDKQGGD